MSREIKAAVRALADRPGIHLNPREYDDEKMRRVLSGSCKFQWIKPLRLDEMPDLFRVYMIVTDSTAGALAMINDPELFTPEVCKSVEELVMLRWRGPA